MRYLGIFLVCLSSIAFEIFLVRHFAITNWSEYGYWVISMAMAGYSVSGVGLCLFGEFFRNRAQALFYALPVAMLLLVSGGYAVLGLIPFNPMELQNEVLWQGQLLNIGKYYLALFPFFFTSGLYVGLSFLANQDAIPKVYMADLVGAGLGAAALLAAMHFAHPFLVPLFLLPPLALAALTSLPHGQRSARTEWSGLALVVAGLSAGVILYANNATYSQYKPLSSALNVENARVLREVRSPRGHYLLVDNYTERHDPDLSNNYELLEAGGPPEALALYRDGERLASLPRREGYDTTYLRAALDSLPYLLRTPERVLLAGGRGGFRAREALMLGARRVDTVESDPVLLDLLAAHRPSAPPKASELRLGLTPPADAPMPAQSPEHLVSTDPAGPTPEPLTTTQADAAENALAGEAIGSNTHPDGGKISHGVSAPTGRATVPTAGSALVRAQAARSGGKGYQLIDVSPEYLDQGQANRYLLTAEGVAGLLRSLDDSSAGGGILSIPMGIGELPVYALKAVATVRAGLLLAGVDDPAKHLMVARSSWTARILASPRPFSPADVEAMRAFARERSFDTPYFPGIVPAQVEVFNDLPAVSFESQTMQARAGGPQLHPQAQGRLQEQPQGQFPEQAPPQDQPSAEEMQLGGSFADAEPPQLGQDSLGQPAGPMAHDALMDDLAGFLQHGASNSSSFAFFNLAPSTQDRPFFHEIIRPTRILEALARIELLPRQEIGYLVNVAVLAQAACIALVVFLLPLVRRGSMAPGAALGVGRVLSGFGYFLCLGLGFLFVEIVLIERFTFFLSDPSTAFAVVLSAMLIASGAGSAFSSRFVPRPRAGIRLACGTTALATALLALALPRLLSLALPWPDAAKIALVVAISAPLGFCMGMPFPLALSTYRGTRSAFIPWAWSVNGALSVVATPLANILAVSAGYSWVFGASLALYAAAAALAPERHED